MNFPSVPYDTYMEKGEMIRISKSDGERKFEIGNAKAGVEARSGKERGTDAAVEAIDGEIAAIHGKNLADPFSFRYPH